MIVSEICFKVGRMVEKKACPPLQSSPRVGGTLGANGFHQVSSYDGALIVYSRPSILELGRALFTFKEDE